MRLDRYMFSTGRYGIVVSLLLLLCSCTRQARHEVLTFFFTGVPPLEETTTSASPGDTQGAAVARMRAEQKASLTAGSHDKTGSKPPQKPQYYSHPVWLDGQCHTCHQGKNLFVFQAPKTSESAASQRVFFSGGGMPGPLTSSTDKICVGCHADKTSLRAIRDQLWLHNPTAKGDCLACHDPHQSKFSGVLRKPVEQICQSCHGEAELEKVPLHQSDGRACLDCHNPHMGKDRTLLRQEYQEQKQPVAGKPQGS